jgi:hypothetical protein
MLGLIVYRCIQFAEEAQGAVSVAKELQQELFLVEREVLNVLFHRAYNEVWVARSTSCTFYAWLQKLSKVVSFARDALLRGNSIATFLQGNFRLQAVLLRGIALALPPLVTRLSQQSFPIANLMEEIDYVTNLHLRIRIPEAECGVLFSKILVTLREVHNLCASIAEINVFIPSRAALGERPETQAHIEDLESGEEQEALEQLLEERQVSVALPPLPEYFQGVQLPPVPVLPLLPRVFQQEDDDVVSVVDCSEDDPELIIID